MSEEYDKFAKFIEENKGKRKFKQTIEIAINFKGIDFAKQENRLNLEVMLPNGKGKRKQIKIFAMDKTLIEEAKKNGIETIKGDELEKLAANSTELTALLDYELVAQPNLMPIIAKYLGQFLGPRNKMPKPLLGGSNVGNIAGDLDKRVSIRNKGKFLPTVHCIVGTEDMEPNKIYDNITEVLNAVNKKIGQNHIKSVYVKLTMSQPMKLV